jgi:hypothetical protein
MIAPKRLNRKINFAGIEKIPEGRRYWVICHEHYHKLDSDGSTPAGVGGRLTAQKISAANIKHLRCFGNSREGNPGSNSHYGQVMR